MDDEKDSVGQTSPRSAGFVSRSNSFRNLAPPTAAVSATSKLKNDEEQEFSLYVLLGALHAADPKSQKHFQHPFFNLPDTVVCRPGYQLCWYFTSKAEPGRILQKNRRNVTTEAILTAFTKPQKKNGKKMPPCDAVAYFINLHSEPDEAIGTKDYACVEYFDELGLRNFLHSRARESDGILQHFVIPQSKNNMVYHCTWSPTKWLAERRQNIHPLNDLKTSLSERVVTFESIVHSTTLATTKDTLTEHMKDVCESVAQHIQSLHRNHVKVLKATHFFRVGADGRLWWMWCSNLRVIQHVRYFTTFDGMQLCPSRRAESPQLLLPYKVEISEAAYSGTLLRRNEVFNCPLCQTSQPIHPEHFVFNRSIVQQHNVALLSKYGPDAIQSLRYLEPMCRVSQSASSLCSRSSTAPQPTAISLIKASPFDFLPSRLMSQRPASMTPDPELLAQMRTAVDNLRNAPNAKDVSNVSTSSTNPPATVIKSKEDKGSSSSHAASPMKKGSSALSLNRSLSNMSPQSRAQSSHKHSRDNTLKLYDAWEKHMQEKKIAAAIYDEAIPAIFGRLHPPITSIEKYSKYLQDVEWLFKRIKVCPACARKVNSVDVDSAASVNVPDTGMYSYLNNDLPSAFDFFEASSSRGQLTSRGSTISSLQTPRPVTARFSTAERKHRERIIASTKKQQEVTEHKREIAALATSRRPAFSDPNLKILQNQAAWQILRPPNEDELEKKSLTKDQRLYDVKKALRMIFRGDADEQTQYNLARWIVEKEYRDAAAGDDGQSNDNDRNDEVEIQVRSFEATNFDDLDAQAAASIMSIEIDEFNQISKELTSEEAEYFRCLIDK